MSTQPMDFQKSEWLNNLGRMPWTGQLSLIKWQNITALKLNINPMICDDIWSFLTTHLDDEVHDLVKGHAHYEQAAATFDTGLVWIILR